MTRRGSVFGMKMQDVKMDVPTIEGVPRVKSRGKPKYGKPQTLGQAQTLAFPMGMKESFIPFAFFRRSEPSKGWGYKSLNAMTKGVQSDELDHELQTILGAMVYNHVVPYHLMHIEHCCNCEEHAMTTRHTPGTYEKKVNDLKDYFAKHIPQVYVENNDSNVLRSNKEFRNKHVRKGENANERRDREERERKIRTPYFKADEPRVGSLK